MRARIFNLHMENILFNELEIADNKSWNSRVQIGIEMSAFYAERVRYICQFLRSTIYFARFYVAKHVYIHYCKVYQRMSSFFWMSKLLLSPEHWKLYTVLCGLFRITHVMLIAIFSLSLSLSIRRFHQIFSVFLHYCATVRYLIQNSVFHRHWFPTVKFIYIFFKHI